MPLQQASPPIASPQSWRVAEVLKAAAAFNGSVTVIPFHTLGAQLHMFHPGKVTVTHKKVPKTAVDCSHLRYTPWLYDPVLSAIMVSFERQAIVPAHMTDSGRLLICTVPVTSVQ